MAEFWPGETRIAALRIPVRFRSVHGFDGFSSESIRPTRFGAIVLARSRTWVERSVNGAGHGGGAAAATGRGASHVGRWRLLGGRAPGQGGFGHGQGRKRGCRTGSGGRDPIGG